MFSSNNRKKQWCGNKKAPEGEIKWVEFFETEFYEDERASPD
jgi:hypothetical protein